MKQEQKDELDAVTNTSLGLGTLIHIGAGYCEELEGYEAAGYESIVLIEVQEGIANTLRKRCAQNQNIKIVNALVTGDKNIDSYFENSLPLFSGLKPISNIQSHFTNADYREVKAKNAVCLNELIANAGLNPKKHNVLVLQVNGCERQLLSKVDKHVLDLFSKIEVQTFNKDVVDDVSYSLVDSFSSFICSFKENSDLIYTRSVYEIDSDGALLTSLQIENDELLKRVEALVVEKSTLTQNLEDRTSTLERLEEQCANKDKTLNEQHEMLEYLKYEKNELSNLIKDTEIANQAEVKSLNDKIAIQKKQIEERDADKAASSQTLKELYVKIEELNKQTENSQQLLEQKDKQIKAVEKQNQELIFRQSQLDEVIARTEAQLELVKDVVLREKAF